MAVPKKKDPKPAEGTAIQILEIDQGELEFHIVGRTPLVMNRMSEKAKRQILLPDPKKTQTQRESTLKHDPFAEFRASPYVLRDDAAPTLLAVLGAAFKRAIAAAAIDLGGKKAQIGRLCMVPEFYVPVYGIPQIYSAVVRQGDMARTPDIRTRAILPRWACTVHVQFVQPIVKPQMVANLLAGAGLFIGAGDGRPEKGALTFGQFRLAKAEDEEFRYLLREGGREAQLAAMRDPVAYDDETSDLLTWFVGAARKRSFKFDAPASLGNGETPALDEHQTWAEPALE